MMNKENRIKRKQIIQKIGLLESEIRALGKQLQALEDPYKLDPYATPDPRQRITKEILLELSPHHTNEEIAEQLEVSVESVRNYKSRWKIKGKNKKPGPERKNA